MNDNRASLAIAASAQSDSSIRVATREDSESLARLITPLGYPIDAGHIEQLWSSWSAEGNVALVVEEQGSVLGVVTLHRMTVLHRPKPVGRITSLAVDPAAQGRGLGRRLVDAAAATLTAAGCGVIEVTSHVRRVDAHNSTTTSGFSEPAFALPGIYSIHRRGRHDRASVRNP